MRRFASLLLLLPLFLAACDSNDPEPPASPLDVQGTYGFTQLRFVPDGSGIVPADVLADRLNAESTELELFADNRRADLTYVRQNGASGRISGTFTVTQATVAITFEGTGTSTLAQLLLPSTLTFQRSGDNLTLSLSSTQNLSSYNSEVYGTGATSVPGQLRVTLERQ